MDKIQKDTFLHVLRNLSIFERADIYVSPAQVRIFPYLIGRESAFADNLKWMACANKGLEFLHSSRPLCVCVCS